MDLIVSNVLVVDGNGGPPFRGSVAVQGDRVEAVLRAGQPEPEALRRIDGAGLVLAPGFIDVHNHSDVVPFVEPGMDSMLRQGITTVVVGNCGSSAIPPAGTPELAEFTGIRPDQLPAGWRTLGEYLERVGEARPGINVATLIGHGALRREVMGEERRAPTRDELASMRRLLSEGLVDGAVGLSTGLIYVPGRYAETDEIVELASALADEGGIYASHIRGEGGRLFGAVGEAVEIGRRAGVPVHISHLKAETRLAWGRSAELLALIDASRRDGVDVSADQYPYTAWESSLDSILPAWATTGELGALLGDQRVRERLAHAVEDGEPGGQSGVGTIGWDRLVIGAHVADPGLTGRSIADIAAATGAGPLDVAFDLLLADRATSIIGHGMLEEDVRAIAAREDVMVATDGLAVSPDGPLGRFNVHPRYYGTFPRVLARYVREEGLLSLPAAVRKMTSLPADRFGLAGRGRIAQGAHADMVLFDADRVRDVATYEAPHRFAEGIDLVLVNGTVAWDAKRDAAGSRDDARGGRALRRGAA